MKIIHLVLGKANPERMNGVNKVAHKLATVQTDMGYDVSLWGISNDLIHNYPPRNFTTRLFQQHRQKMRLDQELITALQSLSEDTVVHFHGVFIREFNMVAEFLHARSIPYVVTPHGALAKAAMNRSYYRKRVYFWLFEKKFLQQARAVQVLGQSGFEHLDHLLPECTKIIIPNGQDLNDLPLLTTLPNENVRFVFCGRLDRNHKGLDLMLMGFAKYRNSGGRGSLELIGGGQDLEALKELADKLELGEAITFHGAKYGDEKWQLINQGDVFMHTSRMEGFPIAVVEAAGLGLPCILSEATNMTAYLQSHQAGIALAKNNPEQISIAMAQMEAFHQEGQLDGMGRNARKMIATDFDWKAIATALFQVYTGRLGATDKKVKESMIKEHVH